MRALTAAMLFAVAAVAQTPAAHVGTAVRMMQDRRYSEASAEFEKALALNPDDDAVRIQYATCLFIQERNDEARAQFEIELRRRGDRPGLEYYLGQLDLRSSNFTSAIARLRPLASNPAFPMASFYLGLAYLSAGQTALAMENLERAGRNNPRDPEVHYRLGRVYSMAGRADDAEREYKLYRTARESERIVEQDAPPCMDALRTQPIDRAREVCGKLAEPGDSRRLILVGQLYAQAQAFGDAVGPLRQAVKLEPQSFEAWHYLGLSLYGLKQYKDAVAPLRRAAELNPQYFDTLNLLAKTLYSLGDYAAALPVLERAHDLNPGDTQLAGVLERLRTTLKPAK